MTGMALSGHWKARKRRSAGTWAQAVVANPKIAMDNQSFLFIAPPRALQAQIELM
jgi:hypothetical protein